VGGVGPRFLAIAGEIMDGVLMGGYFISMLKLGIEDGRSKPGDYIVFEAKMDTLCGLSACPSTGRPFQVVVYES